VITLGLSCLPQRLLLNLLPELPSNYTQRRDTIINSLVEVPQRLKYSLPLGRLWMGPAFAAIYGEDSSFYNLSAQGLPSTYHGSRDEEGP